MAAWSHAQRTVQAKVVYYGPAASGKTANLRALYRLSGRSGSNPLVSIATADDRTLLFDLLPFDLGEVLGYRVALKLYTVPGQVLHDTTRQAVLDGADAVVFVADSSAARQDRNVWSLQNLQMNMRAKGIDPQQVPVLYQFNKQDLPDAAPTEQVAEWLGVPSDEGVAAVASEGRGVLETLIAASRAVFAILTREDGFVKSEVALDDLHREIDSALATSLGGRAGDPGTGHGRELSIALEGDDLVENAVEAGLRIAEEFAAESGRSRKAEREVEGLRRLAFSESAEESVGRGRLIDAALLSVREMLGAQVVGLVHAADTDRAVAEKTLGRSGDPLLAFESGRKMMIRELSSEGPSVVADLHSRFSGGDAGQALEGLGAFALAPLPGDAERALVAYARHGDGSFSDEDFGFLSLAARRLANGLSQRRVGEQATAGQEPAACEVVARTEHLREAYEDLRGLAQVKDRFLNNLSHEMRTPLTAILSAASALRDYKSTRSERGELVDTVLGAAEALRRQLDGLFRLVRLNANSVPLEVVDSTPEELAEEAIRLAGHTGVRSQIHDLPQLLRIDRTRLARAASNLIDNAVKFSDPGATVELRLRKCRLLRRQGEADGLEISVLDRGRGVSQRDHDRIFKLFEQGGDALIAKPSGIGLGLYEARTIAGLHGGKLEYLPRKAGGSKFRLRVPLHPAVNEAVVELAVN